MTIAAVKQKELSTESGVSVESLELPKELLRKDGEAWASHAELDVVRHFTRLSHKNFCIDTNFYPLGSCTMKYNPKALHVIASMSGFLQSHPLTLESSLQGYLSCFYELQDYLCDITGMTAVSLSPMAGAQGEFSGVAMIKAYHEKRGDSLRNEILVPDAAHGTNPASAVMCGFKVREVPTTSEGDLDLVVLHAMVGPQTAGIMLTNPSTLGVFERQIQTIAKVIHGVGGLLYYDGANLNAILGQYRPGDMGFDVVHLNLHKTFATPHGGGGPGSGPVLANKRLAPYLPIPQVKKVDDYYSWTSKIDRPDSIGSMSTFMGNAGVLLRAYGYLRLLGKEGLSRVSQIATLNANYLMYKLAKIGYTLAYPGRRASHEFIVTIKPITQQYGITALDVAKRLLDYGIHAPTVYFPLLVPECLLIEPTETEDKKELDRFIDVMAEIFTDIQQSPEKITSSPVELSLTRLDETKAAKDLNVAD